MEKLLEEKSSSICKIAKLTQEWSVIPVTDEIWNTIRKRCLYMTLGITNKCNVSCKVCVMYDKQGKSHFQELSKEDVAFVMQKIGRNRKVVLFGGEPTLREDIIDIIKIIKDSGNIPMLYTNGIKLADPEYVKMLNKSGIKRIYLSIHSLKEKATAILNGSEHYLYLKLKAIENLKRFGTIKFWISAMIAYGVNDDEISSLLDLVIADKSNLIKGIYFLAATRCNTSLYQLPPDTATSVTYIIKKIEEATSGVLSTNHFHEFTQLKENINKILKQFGAGLPLSPHRLLVKRKEPGIIEPLISLSELREMNHLLEKRSLLALFKYIYKYRDWLGLARRVFNTPTVEFETEHKDEIIFIETTYMTNDPIPSLNRGLLNLAKDPSSFILVNQGPM